MVMEARTSVEAVMWEASTDEADAHYLGGIKAASIPLLFGQPLDDWVDIICLLQVQAGKQSIGCGFHHTCCATVRSQAVCMLLSVFPETVYGWIT